MGPNEAILRDAYAVYEAGDIDAVINLFAEDIVWSSPGAANRIVTAGCRTGRDEVLAYFAAMVREWTMRKFRLIEVIAQDDGRFCVRVAVEWQNNITGKCVNAEKVDLVTMKGGTLTSFAEMLDTAPFERAARL